MMWSDSDLPVMQEASKILTDLGVTHEVKIMSAHRSPHLVADYAQGAEQ
ncbi:MAG: AIR carboxylase family protein, partial [Armatimonadetes bacterium]|nr:AIR carboxylase family protein [Armatimonadota bacterium]